MKIFVQVASYRDPQLLPTLRDCLKNAKWPENLIFGICWQCDEQESLEELEIDKRFKIIKVPYQESRGVCWARNKVQQLYNGEEYTLQIDSHMRFSKDWDAVLIEMIQYLQKKGHQKPLLTGYVPSFNPENDPKERVQSPWRMAFDRFIPEGAVFFLPEEIPNWKDLKEPVPSRFYSAHFCFTVGEFSKEVQHNPEYYFHGEEISIAVRAFTFGYDLFHPHKVILWHEYTRNGRTKQWDDDKNWIQKNDHSHSINRKLFGIDGEADTTPNLKYGFGNVRTLRDYEEYSGILFSERAVQQYTVDRKYPPNPTIKELGDEEKWKNSFLRVFKHCIDLPYSVIPEKDYDFWCVAFHDKNGKTLYRKDADKNEILSILKRKEPYCKIWRSFPTDTQPSYWVVWPYSESKGWCERITGKL